MTVQARVLVAVDADVRPINFNERYLWDRQKDAVILRVEKKVP